MRIVPAILATTIQEYFKELEEIESCKSILDNNWVQIDFMDNKFVPNKSIEPSEIAGHLPKMFIEAQMMVQNPLEWMDQLSLIKPKRVIIPVEVGEQVSKFLAAAKGKFDQVGLSVNPETDILEIKPFISKIDAILIMSVHPGAQGQKFMVEVLEKVKSCVQLRPDNNLQIGIDGGVTVDNVRLIAEAGADYAVVGSHLLKDDINTNYQKFMEILK